MRVDSIGKGVTKMPMLKDWEAHFKTLDTERRYELWKALDALINDPMFEQNYGRDFKELRAALEWAGI